MNCGQLPGNPRVPLDRVKRIAPKAYKILGDRSYDVKVVLVPKWVVYCPNLEQT